MPAAAVPTITTVRGVEMPVFGFGVFRIPDEETERAVGDAIAAGYRSIDTASVYGNERGTGAAIRASAIPRSELFVTSKVWNSDHGYDATLRAFDASLDRLGLDYLDMYLIHWPSPARGAFVDSWRALVSLHRDGRVREIGVSNFQRHHLERVSETGTVPAVNQIELHPLFRQPELIEHHRAAGIVTEAWSPLSNGGALQLPEVREMAAQRGCTPAQLILGWHLQAGRVVIPKSLSPERMRENLGACGIRLSDAEMSLLDGLDRGGRTGPDPDVFDD